MKFSGKNKKNINKRAGGKGKSSNVNNKPQVKTRREIRKDERQRKKNDKVKSYLKRVKNNQEYRRNEKNQIKNDSNKGKNHIFSGEKKGNLKSKSELHLKPAPMEEESSESEVTLTNLSKENMESKRDQKILEEQMRKQRLQSLKDANREEDKVISSLEKQLRLNKRKSKSLPASFISSGLDYILDVCNPEKIKHLAESEKYLQDSGSEFEDDLATIKGQKLSQKKLKGLSKEKDADFSSDEEYLTDSDDASFNDDGENSNNKNKSNEIKHDEFGSDEEFSDNSLLDDLQGDDESEDEFNSLEEFESEDEVTSKNTILNSKSAKVTPEKSKKRKHSLSKNKESEEKSSHKTKKKVRLHIPVSNEESDDELKGKFVRSIGNSQKKPKNKELKTELGDFSDDSLINNDDIFNEENDDSANHGKINDEGEDQIWEDIYGRTRDKQGNVVEANKGKYVPPALRAKALGGNAQKREAFERLCRLLKGLLNRLAESNMHGIATQIEELFMKNSRNDMNESLISLYTEAIVSPVHTPERLIMEYAMLTSILHANIGTEVGAYILQTFVTNFNKLLNEGAEISDKSLDNLLAFICHLYTFKVFDNCLLYDILGVLCDRFKEKDIELILVVLRNVGFSLRKDDPVALKELVLRIQRLANQAVQLKNDSRVNFMLDVLLKIKNNNMSKLPQYDPSHSEHLKKLIKTMIRKGNYVTELKISLQDLLQADERGRWWIVGSAWTGPSGTEETSVEGNTRQSLPTMSDHLTQLAKKLRINTDIRKNIFCILMTAEDFEDAFEKLHKLGLKGQTMNEIVHVVLHCLLQEKEYNHYYALIANRFSQTDRKYRMVVQYSLWDKFKEVENMKPFQVTNLAKFLAYLFIEGTLPLSVLKVIQLVEMTKGNVRLIRQILLSILYHKDEVTAASVFVRLNKSTKLHLFREGLRLFLHHFLLKNMKQTEQDYEFLKHRITMADRTLQCQT